MFFASHFIDVDSFYLFLNRIDLVRVLATTENTSAVAGYINRKFKGLDSREITSLTKIQKVIYKARHFNHRRK